VETTVASRHQVFNFSEDFYGVPLFQRLWRDQGCASLIYHVLLIALITVLVVVGVAVAGSWVQRTWAHLLPLLG
jgi:Flp pilus assembly pilin Flp